jgi:4-aminobutyrate aminotransferase-like enzyme
MRPRREVGPRSREIVAREQRHVAPGIQSFALYAGLAMQRGTGCTLIDADGNEYLDFVAGIGVGSIGHCHPHYVDALKRQVERLTFGSFTTETRTQFLELLATVTPSGLTRIQLFSGGAEAVEAALRLAKAATGKHEVLGFWGGFHGKTGGVLGLLGSDFKHHLGPFLPGQYLSPYADCYRCPFKLSYPDCGIACAEYVRDVIKYQTAGEISAIIVEPVQGTAGNVVPPDGFLRAVQSIARDQGALLIVDEMLTGFGRTGTMWGAEHSGVVPDIMTLGKGIAGGYAPLSAVVTSRRIRDPLAGGSGALAHAQTFSHHPVLCAAGVATLRYLRERRLVERCADMGRVLHRRLAALRDLPLVGDVRGQGLLAGVEFVADPATREPLPRSARLAETVTEAALDEGLVVWPNVGHADGRNGDLVMLAPPFIVTEDQIDEMLELLTRALRRAADRVGATR